jgi:hypothetical protein
MQPSQRLAGLTVVLAASLFGAGCAPAAAGAPGDESVDAQHAAYTSSGTTVGDWHNLEGGVECLVGMQDFYPAQFGVSIPIAPESWNGGCAPEGACHLWLDAQPDASLWEAISSGTPSTYDLIVYPPIGNDPWGHVAAVDHVENGQIFVMDDNYVGHHVRSSAPHTVDWAAYGWFHLRSLPKNGDGGGSGSGSGGGCAGFSDGLYCGGDGVSGDASTLYQCSGGNLSPVQTCDDGCQTMPNGTNDACAPSGGGGGGGGGCSGLNDGLYCGGDYVSGDASTLYQCSGGNLSVSQVCANGCQVQANGTNDLCN